MDVRLAVLCDRIAVRGENLIDLFGVFDMMGSNHFPARIDATFYLSIYGDAMDLDQDREFRLALIGPDGQTLRSWAAPFRLSESLSGGPPNIRWPIEIGFVLPTAGNYELAVFEGETRKATATLTATHVD